MSKDITPEIAASIDTLIRYRKGTISLDEALESFVFLTGLSHSIARNFITSMTRENVVSLDVGKKRSREQCHT